jgi:tetratricopeptide (TPR) repeat protein
MGVALLAAILFYVIYKIAVISKKGNDFQISKKVWFLYFMAIFPIAYLDQQGLFFALTTLVFLTIWGLFVRNKNIYIMLLIGVSSVLFHLLYRYAIAPQLTLMLNGYWPNFYYQSLPIQSYIQNLTFYLSAGLFLFLETFRFLTGNPPLVMGFGIILFFIFYPVFYLHTSPGLPDHYRKFFILGFVELLIINFLIIVMNSLMTLRHPFLILPDIRRAHYWSPAIVILSMTLAVLTDVFNKSRIPRWLLLTVMCFAVIGNIAALPRHRAIMLQWSSKPEIQLSAILLNALKNIDSLADVHDPVIENHPVFQFFKSRNNLPNNADICNGKGIKYAKSGQYQQAIENFNEVIRLKPDYADAYYNRALVYLNQGNKAQCCRDAQKACELGNCKILEFCKSNGLCY